MSLLKKRPSKSKEESAAQIAHTAKIQKTREFARRVFKHLEGVDTIYDAQTVLSAISGFIQYGLVQVEDKVVVSDIAFDISKEKNQKLIDALNGVIEEIKTEKAKFSADTLELMSSKLPQYLAGKYIKEPMSTLKVDDFIA